MYYESVLDYLMSLLDFVKPIGSLIADFFNAAFYHIPEFDMVFSIGSGIMVILIGITLIKKLVAD